MSHDEGLRTDHSVPTSARSLHSHVTILWFLQLDTQYCCSKKKEASLQMMKHHDHDDQNAAC